MLIFWSLCSFLTRCWIKTSRENRGREESLGCWPSASPHPQLQLRDYNNELMFLLFPKLRWFCYLSPLFSSLPASFLTVSAWHRAVQSLGTHPFLDRRFCIFPSPGLLLLLPQQHLPDRLFEQCWLSRFRGVQGLSPWKFYILLQLWKSPLLWGSGRRGCCHLWTCWCWTSALIMVLNPFSAVAHQVWFVSTVAPCAQRLSFFKGFGRVLQSQYYL